MGNIVCKLYKGDCMNNEFRRIVMKEEDYDRFDAFSRTSKRIKTPRNNKICNHANYNGKCLEKENSEEQFIKMIKRETRWISKNNYENLKWVISITLIIISIIIALIKTKCNK